MKNIINEKPQTYLSGRLKASVDFVSEEDKKDKVILDIGWLSRKCLLSRRCLISYTLSVRIFVIAFTRNVS